MSSTDYTVRGMTCGHCAGSVTAEITKIPGVTGV
jgi:copper chaperone CopZ